MSYLSYLESLAYGGGVSRQPIKQVSAKCKQSKNFSLGTFSKYIYIISEDVRRLVKSSAKVFPASSSQGGEDGTSLFFIALSGDGKVR